MEAWILAVVLNRETGPRLVASYRNEQACVEAGARWMRDAEKMMERLKRPRPTGWACMTTEERPS